MSKTNDELYELIVALQRDVQEIKDEIALMQGQQAKESGINSCDCGANWAKYIPKIEALEASALTGAIAGGTNSDGCEDYGVMTLSDDGIATQSTSDAYSEQLKELDDQIGALQTRIAAINSCTCNEEQIKTRIATLESKIHEITLEGTTLKITL